MQDLGILIAKKSRRCDATIDVLEARGAKYARLIDKLTQGNAEIEPATSERLFRFIEWFVSGCEWER